MVVADDDRQLVIRAQRGEQAAMAELFTRHRGVFYAYFNRLTANDRHLADDLFQKLWVQIIEKIKQCREGENFRFWGFTIAKNCWLHHLRYKKIRDKVLFFLPPEQLPETPAPPLTEPENLAEKVERVLATLPPEQSEVFILRRSGLSFKEIAEIQQCSVNTVLSRMRYLSETLREKVGDKNE